MLEPSSRSFLDKFDRLRTATTPSGERAPHKPLLVLLALGRLQTGKPKGVRFEDIEEALSGLLEDFGPPVRRVKPHLPFWHLQSDGIWTLEDPDRFTVDASGSPSIGSLRNHGIGQFEESTDLFLREHPEMIGEVAKSLLETHFPRSLHEDVLQAVGLEIGGRTGSAKRDQRFRGWVLEAYGSECAICGFQSRFARSSFGIDAAHIRWKAHGGPDEVCNGLALCALHHRAFDKGVVGVDGSLRIQVSSLLQASGASREWFLPFIGREIHRPHSERLEPSPDHLAWHAAQVFKGEARER